MDVAYVSRAVCRLALVLLVVGAAAANPCDHFAAGGTPCVAAHAMSRALFSAYAGRLFQLRRASDNATLDISATSPGAAHEAFCPRLDCVVQRIYDQTSNENHLDTAPGGGAARDPDAAVNASRHSTTLGGKKVFAAFFEGKMGYRIDKTRGVSLGNTTETLYMVTSGTHTNNRCCFDYGNAETSNDDTGAGSMEAIYFGTGDGGPNRGSGSGPWLMADLENGLFPGQQGVWPANTPLTSEFVTAMVIGRSDGFALKGGDATQGPLKTQYDGLRPNGGYQPMKKQGAIILGIGGDNSNGSVGTFYEGCITSGASSDATVAAVQADIVSAGYGA